MAIKIVLKRSNSWLNRLRPYKILADGQQVGKIANDKVEEFEVPGISHAIECKVDWTYSNKYTLTEADGSTVYLQVKNGMKGFWIVYIVLIGMIILNLAVPNRQALLGETGYIISKFLFVIPLFYFIYYLTIGRRSYLKLEKDTDNVFAS